MFPCEFPCGVPTGNFQSKRQRIGYIHNQVKMQLLLVSVLASVLLARVANAQGPPPPPPPPPASIESLSAYIFSSHHPSMWSKDMSISPPGPPNPCYNVPAGTEAFVRCNIQVYQSQLKVAASNPYDLAGLVVFSDADGLWGSVDSGSFFEAFSSPVGSSPCDDANESVAPVQVAMSCATRYANTTAVVNMYVVMPDGKKYINDIVYGPTGKVVASYAKHLLSSAEASIFTAGPFAPTVFTLPNYPMHIVALLIGNEGTEPLATGDWAQFDSFAQQGAGFLAWSMGYPDDGFYNPEYLAQNVLKIAEKTQLFIMYSVLEEVSGAWDGRPVNKTPASYGLGSVSVQGYDGGAQSYNTYVNY